MRSLPRRRLGADGPEVTTIGFGGMPLSIAGRPPASVAETVIHAALDAGVTLIDTADVYCLDQNDIGHNERLIGQALRRWSGPSDEIVVATKGGLARPEGAWTRNGRPEHLRQACDASLRALQRDHIDLYQLHAPDPEVPFEESVGALSDLAQAGKVRWVGLSNVSVAEIARGQAVTPILTVQNRLNPFFREALTEGVVDACTAEGIGFLAYSPVGGGRLNKKLPEHPVISQIAEQCDATPHAVVTAWVLAQGPTVIAIPGARTREHARDAASSASLTLTDNQRQRIDDAVFSRD